MPRGIFFFFLILIFLPSLSPWKKFQKNDYLPGSRNFQKLKNFTYPPPIISHLNSLRNITATGFAMTFVPRFTYAVPFVVHYFLKRLPTNWHLILFTHSDLLDEKKKLLKLVVETKSTRELLNKDFHVFPFDIQMDLWTYSCVLLSYEMYNTFSSQKLLLFQADTLVLQQDDYQNDTNSYRKKYLRDFYEYPFVGAPWLRVGPKELSCSGVDCRGGGNGGLSLRDTQAMRAITRDLSVPAFKTGCPNEDTVISKRMIAMKYPNMVPLDVASLFAVETGTTTNDEKKKRGEVIDPTSFSPSSPIPWGIHKTWLYHKHYFNFLVTKHPELHTLSSLHLEDDDEKKKKLFRSWVRTTFQKNRDRILDLTEKTNEK